MTEIYPVSQTIKYSDGSEKVVTFKLPEKEIAEDEIDAELSEVSASEPASEVGETSGTEVPDPMSAGIPKEAEEAPSVETE